MAAVSCRKNERCSASSGVPITRLGLVNKVGPHRPLDRQSHTQRPRRALGAATLVAAGGIAFAHTLDESPAQTWDLHWSLEPWVLLCLASSAAMYGLGLMRLWSHTDAGRGVRPLQAAAFGLGWLVLVAALVSPLDTLGGRLFLGHMIQHELLMIVAAPLLVLGRPLAAWAWALPPSWRGAAGAFFHAPAWRTPWLVLSGPVAAWVAHAVALWGWHVPALFDAALRSEALHAWQHITFLLTALLFWWSILGAVRRAEQGVALISLFTTMVHTTVLGALLTMSPTLWYQSYVATAPAYGLTAIEDQQLGGLVMWVPAGLVYVIAGLTFAARWLGRSERRLS